MTTWLSSPNSPCRISTITPKALPEASICFIRHFTTGLINSLQAGFIFSLRLALSPAVSSTHFLARRLSSRGRPNQKSGERSPACTGKLKPDAAKIAIKAEWRAVVLFIGCITLGYFGKVEWIDCHLTLNLSWSKTKNSCKSGLSDCVLKTVEIPVLAVKKQCTEKT